MKTLMKFQVISRDKTLPDKGINQAYLRIDYWNDFSFVTMFHLSLHDQKGILHKIGNVKIGFKGQDTSISTYKKLNSEFTALDNNFFSVGETLEFYKKIYNLPKHLKEEILSSLNDIVFNPRIIDDIQDEMVFRTSLLRDTSLTSIKGQFHRVLYGMAELTNFNFAFERPKHEDMASIRLNK